MWPDPMIHMEDDAHARLERDDPNRLFPSPNTLETALGNPLRPPLSETTDKLHRGRRRLSNPEWGDGRSSAVGLCDAQLCGCGREAG